jgi:hypothetical protein
MTDEGCAEAASGGRFPGEKRSEPMADKNRGSDEDGSSADSQMHPTSNEVDDGNRERGPTPTALVMMAGRCVMQMIGSVLNSESAECGWSEIPLPLRSLLLLCRRLVGREASDMRPDWLPYFVSCIPLSEPFDCTAGPGLVVL